MMQETISNLESLHLWIALLTGVGGVLVGLGAVLSGIAKLRAIERSKEVGEMVSGKKRKYRRVAGAGAVVLAGGLALSIWATGAGVLPLNVELTNAAWKAFNDEDWEAAARKAGECIEEFRGQAILAQEELEQKGEPLPPEGRVSEQVAEKIHSRGLLNDVATCYFIRGKAYQAMGRNAEAREAYENAAKFTYARTWDPKGWFWSPSNAARGQLKTLEE